jgi:hypothetical protein
VQTPFGVLRDGLPAELDAQSLLALLCEPSDPPHFAIAKDKEKESATAVVAKDRSLSQLTDVEEA